MSSTGRAAAETSSDQAVQSKMAQGLETVAIQTGVGLVVGGLLGVVVARGGGSNGARKAMAGLGAGIGLGSAWTRTSMDIEDVLAGRSSGASK